MILPKVKLKRRILKVKKIALTVIMAMMIMLLAACGKGSGSSDNGEDVVKITPKADDKQQNNVDNKKNETVPEPTKKPADDLKPTDDPEPTADPEPTDDPEPVYDPDDPLNDEFYSPGHAFQGVWIGDGCVLRIVPEGAADIITAYFEYTDEETFGSWHEYWTNYSESEFAFISSNEIYHYFDDDMVFDVIENENRFAVQGLDLYWVNEDITFEQVSENAYDFDLADYFFNGESEPYPETGLTDDEALTAVRNYCLAQNAELQSHVDADEYNVSWGVMSSEEDEIVVWFRSYTGAYKYFYIDPVSGDTYVTEFVPLMMDNEQMTDEKLNVRDYLD